MTEMELIIDFYKDLEKLGPGSPEITEKAFNLTGLDKNTEYKAADIGCGTGAQTLTLADITKCSITAVDLFQIFLDKLQIKINNQHLENRISTLKASMDDLPFTENSLDLIWSEGAVYSMGFENGIKYWNEFLKMGGVLAVSEISWLTDRRPEELENYWMNAYPEINTAGEKRKQLVAGGYRVIDDFIVPESCWLEDYYKPMEKSFDAFLEKHKNNPAAEEFIAENIKEIELYKKYKDYYSYGFYIAEKI